MPSKAFIASFEHGALEFQVDMDVSESILASLDAGNPCRHDEIRIFSVAEPKIMDHFAVSYLQSRDACLLLLSAPLLSFLFFHGDGRHFELGIGIAQHPNFALGKGKTHSRCIHCVINSHG